MTHKIIQIKGQNIDVYSLNTVIVGTGAAGFNAADCLYDNGQKDIAMVSEGVNCGTSRNTGSDKQTYYKLSLSGGNDDSVEAMANDLFSGGCVDGDIALCEAAMSVSCFIKLNRIGVDFPINRYGEFVGYQTDHDTRGRATSVGPLTSKFMTVQLEKQVKDKGIKIFDKTRVIAVLTDGEKALGLLCYTGCGETGNNFAIFCAKNIVYATGGPAGMYADSVFPESQTSATGAAIEAGVKGKNLTEWQFGLASTNPRWNVSGTYMQVLPRFVSIDKEGNEYEFVTDYFGNYENALSMIFKKGYQWPFDVRKINGSSIIDLLVYQETCIFGREVYLDFINNPLKQPLDISKLEQEAQDYIISAEANFGTPIERLIHMNAPAYDLYLEKGVDLKKDYLPIALCAQHNNGGLDVDCWWQSNIKGFFPCGEVAGSHGVFRPGGSALNAGQVGSARAARYIAFNCKGEAESVDTVLELCSKAIEDKISLFDDTFGEEDNTRKLILDAQKRMSLVGGAVRNKQNIASAIEEIDRDLASFRQNVKIRSPHSAMRMYRLYDILLCSRAYLTAMLDYAENGGQSRGSALYSVDKGELPRDLPEIFRYVEDNNAHSDVIQETTFVDGEFVCDFRPVRPIPKTGGFFENVWRDYRLNGNVY